MFSNSRDILSLHLSSKSLGFVQFVALCFKRPFTSTFFSFHDDYYDSPLEIQLFSARSARAFLFSRQLRAPLTIMRARRIASHERLEFLPPPPLPPPPDHCFIRRSKSQGIVKIPRIVNSIDRPRLLVTRIVLWDVIKSENFVF